MYQTLFSKFLSNPIKQTDFTVRTGQLREAGHTCTYPVASTLGTGTCQ